MFGSSDSLSCTPIVTDQIAAEAIVGDNTGGNKASQVICYNCGELGHFISTCSKPKVCFVCFRQDHIADKCLRWREPEQVVQFMGSASKGLGFFHLDVSQDEDRFKLWSGFDNCGVFTIEEGEMDQETLLKHIKVQFNTDWPWQL